MDFTLEALNYYDDEKPLNIVKLLEVGSEVSDLCDEGLKNILNLLDEIIYFEQ